MKSFGIQVAFYILTFSLTASPSLFPFQAPLSNTMTSQVITDALPAHHSVQIFASLIRDVDSVALLLSSTTQNFTLLAPNNGAMKSLPHKPWEDPAEYKAFGTNVYEGPGGQDRAQKNIKKFVEAHVVPKAGLSEGEKVATLVGVEKAVWWEDAGDGKRKIAPDGVSVESVAGGLANGEIWIIDGTLKA